MRGFDTVVITSFETSQMARMVRSDGNMRCKNVQSMLTWGHYCFRERLTQKALEHGKEVVVCEERYTSKRAAGAVGDYNPGSSKKYKFEFCGLETGQDENAARNNFLKHLFVIY